MGLIAAGCAAAVSRGTDETPAVTTTVAPPTPVAPAAVPAAPVTAAPPAAPLPSPAPVPPPRVVTGRSWTPFAVVGPVTLTLPASAVERVGFHESNHDGARQLEPLGDGVATVTLETRERGTGSRTAADVVVDPETEIRAPVSGTVKRAGTYVLYCDYSDDFAVIEPHDRPGWEVKVLHIDGVRVRRGQRVTAGETVLAGRATRLPFESQVDEVTAEPAWPHVHIEVVDPTIRDRPGPGGGCN